MVRVRETARLRPSGRPFGVDSCFLRAASNGESFGQQRRWVCSFLLALRELFTFVHTRTLFVTLYKRVIICERTS